ncbi:unnamed protein product [Caenorhabditis auriculariae]|uniref:DUF19 domain-containing protein n=1 Tax=Caenorhabditis auriculariae TaxID=2777116 RepID=A0A8S1GYN8_9PELO|nr:unnamed protein product [Caenorhabditis auriculariae]
MRALVFVSLCCAVCVSQGPMFSALLPVPDDYLLSEQEFQKFFFTDSKDFLLGQCNSVQFNTAQAGFANAIGAPVTTTWRDAYLLTNLTYTMINQGLDSLAAVCTARQQFVQTLGASYDTCVNKFYLLGQGQTTFGNVLFYTHLMRHLEFICSSGFDVYQRNLDCIRKAETTDGTKYRACFYKFNATVNADPNNFCGYTETFLDCIQDYFVQECNSWVGWMECEMERVGFAGDCLNLKC